MNFHYVTLHESEKFIHITKKILADAKQYSFHFKGLSFFIACVLYGGLTNIPTSAEYYYVFNSKGWAVILEQPGFVEIKYIFVYPEYRRKGFFTQLLKLLKVQKKEITVCSKEEIMIKALVSKGFKLHGRSLCGTELNYKLIPE